MNFKINNAGLDIIKEMEGLRLTAYLCPSHIPTIGWGNTSSVKMSDVGRKTITKADAETLLKKDLVRFEADVNRLVTSDINENQFSALVSLCYNIGSGAFAKSTLLRMVNMGDYSGAAGQFSRWNRGGGRVLPGLVKRRALEEALFRKPVATKTVVKSAAPKKSGK
ncbi:hypothetical protein A6U96_13950 [Agrobacterium tumefaciens]|nr:hypothetical protein A6U96_13950 [Agrobacterium tumefaciens]